MKWFDETLYPDCRQRFRIDTILYQEKTDHQDLVIFENARFGRILALDGVIQTTQADEFIYHEMLTHVPLIGHGEAKNVLIIGGGDGGILREVLKHEIASATLVEIDDQVIKLCREHLPFLSDGAFDDSRVEIVITDGIQFVAECNRHFDVIIVDSTDPIGPGAVLFTSEFYESCHRRLTPGGILVTQNGVPFLQPDEIATSYRRLSPIFEDATFYVATIPTYYGGVMTLGWASDDPANRQLSLATVDERAKAAGIAGRYYTPAVHLAAFALPAYVQEAMGRAPKSP